MTENDEKTKEQFIPSSHGDFICEHCGYVSGSHQVLEGILICPS